MANEFKIKNGLYVSGSTTITNDATVTGSLVVSGGITGSLLGTSSYAVQALSSSFALTSSYSLSGTGFPYSGSAVITGSLLVTNLSGSGVRYVITDQEGNITAQTASAAIKVTQTYTASAGQTTFSVANGYSTGYVDVFINGTKLNGSEFTDTSGTNIVLASGSFVNDIVEVVKYLPASGVSNNVLRTLTTFTAASSQSTFNVDYTPGLLDIFYNGSRLSPIEYTANNGTSFTLATASNAGDILDVMVYSYQVGAYAGIGGSGQQSQVAYYTTTSSISGSNNFTFDGSTLRVTGSIISSGSSTFVNIGPTILSGSLTVSGSITATGGVTISGSIDSASYASNAERLDNLDSTSFVFTSSYNTDSSSISGRVTTIESKYATTGSNIFQANQTICANLTTTGTITAQTINVQQVTSSVVYSSGSNIFGNDLTNTQQFTGSMFITGSNFRVSSNSACFTGNLRVDRNQPDLQLNILSGSQYARVYFLQDPVLSGGVQLIGTTFTGTRKCRLELFSPNAGISFTTNGQFESPTMFATGSRVGVGTVTPSYTLDVNGTAGFSDSTIITRNANSLTRLTISNTTAGANAYVETTFTADSSAGSGAVGKFGSSTTPYKITTASNTYLYNGTTAGDIAILNDFSQGNIKLAAGGSSTSHMFISASGNVGIGTSSPSYKLDITNSVAATTNLEPISLRLYNGSDGGSAIYFNNSVGGQSKLSFGIESTGAGTDDTYIAFSTGANTALSERMRIQSDGTIRINAGGATTSATLQFYADPTPSNGASIAVSYLGSGAYGPLTFGTGGSEKMRITSGGDVGVNTTSPGAKLDVCQMAGPGTRACDALYLRAGNNSNVFCSNQILFGYNGSTDYAHAIKTRHQSNNAFENAIDFFIWNYGDAAATKAGKYVMTIAGNGNVGIGTCSPSSPNLRLGEKLAIVTLTEYGGASFTTYAGASTGRSSVLDLQKSRGGTDGSMTAVENNDEIGYVVFRGANGSSFQDIGWIRGQVDGTVSSTAMPGAILFATTPAGSNTALERMRITSGGITCFAGTVCSPCFATISDYRMKSNLRPIDGLSIIMNTKPYKFEYNYDCSTSFGVIAHELQQVVPEAVFGEKDGEVMQGVDYMKLLPITIKAIQEQQCTICSQSLTINLLKTCLGII